MLLPFTPLGPLLGLVIPPITFFIVLVVFIVAYLTLTEVLKRYFYKRLARNV
jgi:Mg2+-importing ATPase